MFTHGFVPVRNDILRQDQRRRHHAFIEIPCPHRMISLQVATQRSSRNNNSNNNKSNNNNNKAFGDILEDDKGHINPELAQLIWKWEKQQKLNMNLPDFQDFSTRDGLRWVKELVDGTIARSSSGSNSGRKGSTAGSISFRHLYHHLVQITMI